MESQSIQIMIVDDHTMVRKGLKVVLENFEGIRVIGDAANGLNAIELVEQLKPDVILMDLSMPGMDGVEATQKIMDIRPKQRILVLSACLDDERFIKAIHAGAQGCIGKNIDPEGLVQAIQDVHAGKPALDPGLVWKILHGLSDSGKAEKTSNILSEREMDVLRLLTQGKRDYEIAQELVLSEVTIRTHITRILSKLHLENRVQAALFSLRTGLVSLTETAEVFDTWWRSAEPPS